MHIFLKNFPNHPPSTAVTRNGTKLLLSELSPDERNRFTFSKFSLLKNDDNSTGQQIGHIIQNSLKTIGSDVFNSEKRCWDLRNTFA